MKRLFLTLTMCGALGVSALAQARGIPASAVSLRPGQVISRGIPASVSSPGPFGFGTSIAPISDIRFHRRLDRRFRLSHAVPFFNTLPIVQVVVAPGEPEIERDFREPQPQKLEVTIVDKRGPPQPPEQPAPRLPMEAAPEPPPLPATTLVLRDGTRRELKNFAIMAGVIYDLANEKMFSIELAAVDRDATNQANAAAGRTFQLP